MYYLLVTFENVLAYTVYQLNEEKANGKPKSIICLYLYCSRAGQTRECSEPPSCILTAPRRSPSQDDIYFTVYTWHHHF